MNVKESYTSVLEIFKAASDITDPGYGRFAYETWESFNTIFFEDELRPGAIHWGLTPKGHLASYDFTCNILTFSRKHWLRAYKQVPVGEKVRRSDYSRYFVSEEAFKDFLLHEMIHQKIYQFEDESKSYTVKSVLSRSSLLKANGINDYDVVNIHVSAAWLNEVNRINTILQETTIPGIAPLRGTKNLVAKVRKGEGVMDSCDIERFPYAFRSYFNAKVIRETKHKKIKGKVVVIGTIKKDSYLPY